MKIAVTLLATCILLLPAGAQGAAATPAQAYEQMSLTNYAVAAELWQQLIQQEPEFVVALNNLAYCKMLLGEYDAAAGFYMKADAISQNLDSKAGVQWAHLAAGRPAESIPWGKAALGFNATNYWVKYRLALAHEALDDREAAEKNYSELVQTHGARSITLAPKGQLIPYYQAINYSGSSLKSTGFDAGMFALWNFDAGTTTGAGYAYNSVQNPKGGEAYTTQEIRLMTGFLFSDMSSLTLNGHVLSSNSTFLNRGVTLSATHRNSLSAGLSLTADALIFPQHGGAGFTPMYYINLSRHWQLGVGGSMQVIGFSSAINAYGAAQAALRYCASVFCLSAGGLYGSLFTPLIDAGNILAYNPDELTLQGFAKLTVRPADYVEVSAGYTYARWKAISGESPVSGIFSIAVTGSLR